MGKSVNTRRTDRQIKNLFVNGHRTSLRLEIAFWDGFETCAREQGKSVHQLANSALEKYANITSSLSSAVRMLIIDYFRDKSIEAEKLYNMSNLAIAGGGHEDPVESALARGRDFLDAMRALGSSARDSRELRKVLTEIKTVLDRTGRGSR